MAKKLFVGGLSYETTEKTLKEVFSQVGTVESATVITDKISGRSKGFGFVEMSSEEEAKEAIEKLNGKEIDGKSVTVNEARPMEARPRDGGGFKRAFRGGDRRGGFDRDKRDRW
jgi:RNA recognition motif-containing protein